MIKKFRLTLLVFFLFCMFFGNTQVEAKEQVSQLTFEHISIGELSTDQQNQLTKGQPQGIAKADKESFTFVYQPVKVASSNSSSTQLPKTNATDNRWALLLGIGLIVFAFLLFRKKRKSVSLLIFVIAAGVTGTSSIGYAAPTALIPTVVQTVAKGSAITYQVPEISGYQYVGYLLSEKNNEVVNPTSNGKVTVDYLDEAGKPLTEAVMLTGIIGTEYDAEQKVFAGYDFVSVTGTSKGLFTESEQKITFNYKKRTSPVVVENGAVTYKYQDTDGATIHPDVTAEGKIGEAIPENKLEISGYRYNATINGASQTFSNEPQVIIYQYQAQGKLSFNLKIQEPFAGSPMFDVNDYIKQRLPQGATINSFNFATLNPVTELNETTFTTLINGGAVEFIGDKGTTFGSITDSRKDNINTLLNYANTQKLNIHYNYSDSSGTALDGNIVIVAVRNDPTAIDNLEFATDQSVTIVLTIGVPN
ncbi:MucBP domain-containing protein [Enterococcus sp. UD-01]|jgi:LPXTG-motif cell wall-anchored protein|uniref:MucBP domain-containing protein n=1 Tax=Enterococcus sp. UD-01 TaxID=3373911 RepID=UPI003833F552